MNNTSASEDLYSQDNFKSFHLSKCPDHQVPFVTLYREVKGENGVISYANSISVCPGCVNINNLGHWKERPAGYVTYGRNERNKNGQIGHAQMQGERLTHSKVSL